MERKSDGILPESSVPWEVKKISGGFKLGTGQNVFLEYNRLTHTPCSAPASAGSVTGSLPALADHLRAGSHHSCSQISIRLLALLKVTVSAEGLGERKQWTDDPIVSSVAFKPSASLNLEKGTSKDTHEYELPMARWWETPVMAASFWFFSDRPLCAAN